MTYAERIAAHHATFGLDADAGDIRTHFCAMKGGTVNWEQRLIQGTVTTDDVDMDGEVIDPEGIDTEYFMGTKSNPGVRTVYHDHNYGTPIGRCLKFVRKDNGFYAQCKITTLPIGDDILTLVDEGILNGQSIGVRVRDMTGPNDEDDKRWRKAASVIRTCSMLEYSITPMPCNPKATIDPAMKGRVEDMVVKGFIQRSTGALLGYLDRNARTVYPTTGPAKVDRPKAIVLTDDGRIVCVG